MIVGLIRAGVGAVMYKTPTLVEVLVSPVRSLVGRRPRDGLLVDIIEVDSIFRDPAAGFCLG